MTAAAKVLAWAAVGLYDEALLLLKANVVWFLISLPLSIPVVGLVLWGLESVAPALVSNEELSPGWPLPLMASALLLPLIPNPASLGRYRVAAVMQRRESPPSHQFWDGVRRNVRLGLTLYLIGLLRFLI